MAIVFSSKLAYVPEENLYSGSNLYTGYALFWGGLIVGMCNFICGIAVGINGSSAALADAADPTLYVLALFSLLCFRLAYIPLTDHHFQVRQNPRH